MTITSCRFWWFLVVTLGALSCLCLSSPISRVRRSGISDQRLAELETLLALAKLKGRANGITMPVAFGVIDPDRIGRRKRSQTTDKQQNNYGTAESPENIWYYYRQMAPHDQHDEEAISRTSDEYYDAPNRRFDPSELRLWRSWLSKTRRPSREAVYDYQRA